eukprot:Tbor_TRINITY_DN4188_c0_g1::TRINITY_DN4188_c0_g1_i1::g.26591::m.26591
MGCGTSLDCTLKKDNTHTNPVPKPNSPGKRLKTKKENIKPDSPILYHSETERSQSVDENPYFVREHHKENGHAKIKNSSKGVRKAGNANQPDISESVANETAQKQHLVGHMDQKKHITNSDSNVHTAHSQHSKETLTIDKKVLDNSIERGSIGSGAIQSNGKYYTQTNEEKNVTDGNFNDRSFSQITRVNNGAPQYNNISCVDSYESERVNNHISNLPSILGSPWKYAPNRLNKPTLVVCGNGNESSDEFEMPEEQAAEAATDVTGSVIWGMVEEDMDSDDGDHIPVEPGTVRPPTTTKGLKAPPPHLLANSSIHSDRHNIGDHCLSIEDGALNAMNMDELIDIVEHCKDPVSKVKKTTEIVNPERIFSPVTSKEIHVSDDDDDLVRTLNEFVFPEITSSDVSSDSSDEGGGRSIVAKVALARIRNKLKKKEKGR